MQLAHGKAAGILGRSLPRGQTRTSPPQVKRNVAARAQQQMMATIQLPESEMLPSLGQSGLKVGCVVGQGMPQPHTL